MIRIKLLALAACVLCTGGLVAALWKSAPAEQPRPVPGAAPEPAPDPSPIPEAEAVQPLVRLGDARLRHTAPVKSIALTHDGAYLLTATREEPVLHLWNVKTGKLVRSVRVEEEFTASMTVLALTPDARTAFVMRHQWRQRVSESHKWHEPATVDLTTGAVKRWPLGTESENLTPVFALSPDGKTAAGVIGREVRAWDIATGAQRVLGEMADWSNSIGSISFAPDGKHIAVGGATAAFYVAPIDGNGPLRRVAVKCDKADVRGAHWHAPDRVVAVWIRGLAAYDPATGTELAHTDLANVNLSANIFFCAPTSAGGKLFSKTNDYGPIETFDLADLTCVPDRTYDRSERNEPFAVSTSGNVLAVVSGHAVRLFDPKTGKPLHPELETAPYTPLTRLYASPNGARLMGCTDHSAHAWHLSDSRTLTGISKFSSWSMTRFALSPDGRFAAGGYSKDGSPLVVELQTGREITLPKGDADSGGNEVIGFADSNRAWLWNSGANTFTPVEIGTNRTGPAVQGFAGAVFVAVSPDGRKIAAAGHAGLALRDFNTERGWVILDEYKERSGPKCGLSPPPCGVPVRFSPCGRWLLVDDHGLEVWDIRKRPIRAGKFDTPRSGEWMWSDGSISPDGRYLTAVVRAKDGSTELCVWETASASEVYRFRPARGVAGCSFTADGKRLVIAHQDTTLSVWDRSGIEARQLGAVPAGEEWKWLGSRDAKQAHAAARALVTKPERALEVLAPQFVPAEAALTDRLIAGLDDKEYRVREAAERALAELGARAEQALRVAVTKSESPEVRARAAVLLRALGPGEGRLAGERLRAARAVEVLEGIASPEAKKLLAIWAATYPNSPLASEANAALKRMRK
jgi:WD40 repeat protein